MELRTGCSGWSYDSWKGPFYSSGTENKAMLAMYARVFNVVEIDSTFYGVPEDDVIESWKSNTTPDFLFCPKMPGALTHDGRLRVVGRTLESFLRAANLFGEKLGPVLVQLPPSLAFDEGIDRLESLLSAFPRETTAAVEFRHHSWFRAETYELLNRNRSIMVWSEIPHTRVPPVTTSSEIYLRLVGDRSIDERDFGSVRRDMSTEIGRWATELRRHDDVVARAFVFSNNHFQGFAPATVNLFRRNAGLETLDWAVLMRSTSTERQKTLF